MATVRFRTSDGVLLEGDLREADGSPKGTAVLCHAHPSFGGSKDHPVLWAIRNHLAARRGLHVLAFNFRGTMGSEGSHGGGGPELADLDAAITTVRAEADGPTVVAGWSFGANVALRHAVRDDRVAALALVALPLGPGAVSDLPPPPRSEDLQRLAAPVLLVAGSLDRLTSVNELQALADRIPRARLLLLPGTGHYFERREAELAEVIGDFVGPVLRNGSEAPEGPQ
jgi:alpha/beta superfamily hydrolase